MSHTRAADGRRGRTAPLDQDQTPYFDALLEYVTDEVLTFHVPGHQQGRGAPEKFRRFLREHALAGDITQVLGLDDIHRPVSHCKLAQELAAVAYGSRQTYFLVNGSTSGNHAMLLSSLRPDDVVLVPRTAHKSTIGALLLSGARPVFYVPSYDPQMCVYHGPSVESVRELLDRTPEATALYLTSPTYYGAAADVQGLTELAHSRGLLVLADEAWGPHLPFHPELPVSALEAGADLVVHSTHKLMAGISQASMLHRNSERVDRGRLEAVLRICLSTSPCCLLIASLDVARHQMATAGQELLGEAIRLARWARQEIDGIPGIRCFGEERRGLAGVAGWDPTRLVFTARDLGHTGFGLERFLRHQHNLQIEMSDLFNAVAVVTLGHRQEHLERLIQALRSLPGRAGESTGGPSLSPPPFPEQRMTLRRAFDAPFETLPLTESVGRICAELVTPYPPGIPLLCPGEVVTRELVDYLKVKVAAGVHIEGAFDPELQSLRVVRSDSRPRTEEWNQR
ncbi:MAG: aminotransferase class V-fold PLP-dependent enzyme [Armatimonadetes bacterium]|nr:aminotransferase class V-fold PLP-dependent enzyme [Armatimonadota bacterium]